MGGRPWIPGSPPHFRSTLCVQVDKLVIFEGLGHKSKGRVSPWVLFEVAGVYTYIYIYIYMLFDMSEFVFEVFSGGHMRGA